MRMMQYCFINRLFTAPFETTLFSRDLISLPFSNEVGQSTRTFRGEDAISTEEERRPFWAGAYNALGYLLELLFAEPESPVRTYNALARRAGISRHAIKRY